MSKGRLPSILFFCLLSAGCTGGLHSAWAGPKQGSTLSIDDYRQKAVALEQQGDLQQALFAYRVAAILAPEDGKIAQAVTTLEQKIANAADDHYVKGVAYFQSGNYTAAHHEFLIVLRLSPEYKDAKHYLKIRIPLADRKVHKVQRGDSFAKIALEAYGDPSKAYVIAYFNDLDPEKPLWVGRELLLPNLSASQILPKKDLVDLVEKAQSALDQKRYAAVLEFVEKIRAQQPENMEIVPLSDAAHYALGMSQMERKDYSPALEQFKQLSAGYEGRAQAIGNARRNLQRQKDDAKLRMAKGLYAKGDFGGAINVTEELMALESDNQEVKSLSDAAHYALGKQLLDQGKAAQAIEALKPLGKGYQDTAQLLNLAHARLNASAEEYYRKGVKQFLNEELEQAIASWEKALALNPEHPKAQQDIDNAMRLLEKWRGLDQGDKIGH